MKNKNKKWLIIAGALALCTVLIVVISSQYKKAPVEDVPIEDPASDSASVIVDPVPIVIADNSGVDDGPPAVDSGPDQTIQGDVEKPEAPPPPEIDEDAASDPNNVPSYTPEQTNPQGQQPAEPSGGETRPGQIYVPGFGWIADEGGGGVGIDTGSDGDPNKQVGDM